MIVGDSSIVLRRQHVNPRQLMSFLGLVPSERSTGDAVRRAGLTLTGNRRARRVLIEGAWTYRYPARVSETLRTRIERLPKAVRDIACRSQVRLCARYRRMRLKTDDAPLDQPAESGVEFVDFEGLPQRSRTLSAPRTDGVSE